jgi:hypothetical protein
MTTGSETDISPAVKDEMYFENPGSGWEISVFLRHPVKRKTKNNPKRVILEKNAEAFIWKNDLKWLPELCSVVFLNVSILEINIL